MTEYERQVIERLDRIVELLERSRQPRIFEYPVTIEANRTFDAEAYAESIQSYLDKRNGEDK